MKGQQTEPARRSVVVYTLASSGMAHATRAVPMVERLSKRFEVHLFCGGPAYTWLGARFPNVHRIRRFNPIYVGDHVSIPLVLAHALLTLPISLWSMAKIARVVLGERAVAVVTDFEALGTYTALLLRPFVRPNIVELDNFCAARLAEPPFEASSEEKRKLGSWARTVRAVVPYADTHLVESVVHPPLTHPRARYVPPPIRDDYLHYDGPLRTDGPIVVCLGGTIEFEWLPAVLQKSHHRFCLFGWSVDKDEGNIAYRRFDEANYKAALAAAPFAIVRGISSALDALALKKPVLVNPASGQTEHWYNGRMFESLGVGRSVPTLDPSMIDAFYRDRASFEARVRELALFDNARVFLELERAIDGR